MVVLLPHANTIKGISGVGVLPLSERIVDDHTIPSRGGDGNLPAAPQMKKRPYTHDDNHSEMGTTYHASNPAKESRRMTRKKPTNRKRTSSRSPGDSGPGKRAVTPAVLQKIGRLWLEGRSKREIAREIGVDESTIRYHLTNHIQPIWEEKMRSRLAEDLAKVAHLERTAWERFHAHSPAETVEQVEQALLEGGNRLKIVKKATKSVTKMGEVVWLQVVQWCLEFRARIHAHYAPTRHHVDHGGELRVAGMTPSEVDQKMIQKLFEQIKERQKYNESLGSGPN